MFSSSVNSRSLGSTITASRWVQRAATGRRLSSIELRLKSFMIGCAAIPSAHCFLPGSGRHDYAVVGEQPAVQPKFQRARLLVLQGVEKDFPRDH